MKTKREQNSTPTIRNVSIVIAPKRNRKRTLSIIANSVVLPIVERPKEPQVQMSEQPQLPSNHKDESEMAIRASTTVKETRVSKRRATDSKVSYFTTGWSVFCKLDVWRRALSMHVLLLRNVLACIAVAWAANYFVHLGNVFTLRASEYQSRSSLLVANLVWTNLLFCLIIVFVQTTVLLPNSFIACSNRKPSVWFCVKRLICRSYRYYVISLLCMIATGVAAVESIPVKLQKFKFDFYVAILCNHIYTTGILLVTKQIYRQETVEGRERQQAQQGLPSLPAAAMLHQSKTPLKPKRKAGFWRTYWQNIPKVLSLVFAGGYTSVVSQSGLFDNSYATTVFVVISLLAKLFIQELAKSYLLRRNVQSLRTMSVLVGLPTVLIDTQVRIVLLGAPNNKYIAVGTIVMACVEIVLRVSKAALVKTEIRQLYKQIEQPRLVHANDVSVATTRALKARYERWKRQVVSLHTAEVNADMYAEYIAIGCSASILYFYGHHPKYRLKSMALSYSNASVSSSSSSGEVESNATVSNSVQSTSTQVRNFAFQVCVEVVVDYIACALETALGIEVDNLRKLSSFFALFFMTSAVINIEISATIYLT